MDFQIKRTPSLDFEVALNLGETAPLTFIGLSEKSMYMYVSNHHSIQLHVVQVSPLHVTLLYSSSITVQSSNA